MAVTRDDAVDVVFDILAGDLDFFGNRQNRRAGVELLIQRSPEVRGILDETLSLLRNYEDDLSDTKDALSGRETIEYLLESDTRDLRDRILVKLPEVAAQPLQDLETERTANTRSATATAVKMLEAESVADPLNELAVRISPSVREAVAATPAEDRNVFEEGIDNFIARTVPSEVRSAYESIMNVARASTTFSPEAVRRVTEATVGDAEDAEDDEQPVMPSADEQRAVFEQQMYGRTISDADDGASEVVETPVVQTGGAPQLTAAQIRDANQAEVEALLASQFGGFSFFLQRHRSELQVGLTADGQVVAADDPNAASVKNILDVIVDQGITAPTRVLGLLENTEWWQKTDAKMREYDVLTADMSEPQKTEYLEPVLDLLREEAQFLGFQLDSGRARDLAEQITRMGEENDSEYIRGLLTAEESFNAAEVTASSFAAARNEIVAMSKRYFTPINEADAAAFAEDIYVGTKTTEGVEQYFREMAAAKFPQLQNALNANMTPEQYFAPYKYEIERMLDRPNVDLYEEFGDVIQFIPDTGTGEARPMTLGEVRKYVRGLDEWQQSSQGKDSARALAFSIGKTFGEVA
jgi:hypothetical protein